MLAKSWKKICLVILIIACLWNIVSKFIYKISFEEIVDDFQDNYKQEQNDTNTIK